MHDVNPLGPMMHLKQIEREDSRSSRRNRERPLQDS